MSDTAFLILTSAIVLLSILICFRYSKKVALANLGAFLVYSDWSYYGLLYKSQYGASLVWWFYLLVFNAVHFVIVVTYLLRSYFWSRKKDGDW